MKFTNTLSLIAITATACSAFTPAASLSHRNKVTLSPKSVDSSTFTHSKTTLFNDKLPDGVKDQVDELQEKADKYLQVFAIDIEKAQDDLAKNWGWITGAGVLTMGLGAAFLLLPQLSTGVAYDTTVLTLGATGVVSLLSAFVRENGHKAKSALSGVLYLGLTYFMATNPLVGLNAITFSIASVIAAEGLYEAGLAIKNKDLEGRPWHFVSGVGSVLAGLWLTSSVPVASLFAPGIALGSRLTTNGATKVAVGLAGRELAAQRN